METVKWFLFVDCCGWVVTLGSACVEICWGWDHWKSGVGCRQLGQKLNYQGTLMGAEWALPWVISCRLLQLNPRVQGEHLTSHLSWEAA